MTWFPAGKNLKTISAYATGVELLTNGQGSLKTEGFSGKSG
jgi:hypothetical protein